ncbi:MAG: GNAT family N-acetyltransferase [Bacteroidia bacterium]|nr:GNAT family N-acetyltransferase [Bacteroidia bacterium]NNC84846.1 GNAT family N-acetyltransferase [Bacteroidia bacterium]
MDNTQIIEFENKYAKDFADLNYEWIAHFFKIESIDQNYLDNPQEKIIDQGGAILLAKFENKIVGTIALINEGNNVYELAKMSVHKDMRGKRLGHRLMDACIAKAKQLNADKIIILSNRKLENAIHLYEKYGFIDLGSPETDYERCDIYMELTL